MLFLKVILNLGYGVAGYQLSNNDAWYVNKNVNDRILDGVIGAATTNPTRNPSYRPMLCSLSTLMPPTASNSTLMPFNRLMIFKN